MSNLTQIQFHIFDISGKNRWVIYNPNVGVEYDGSMIPAEWFGWMHYKTDTPPTEVWKGLKLLWCYIFLEIFFPNLIMSLQKAPVKYKWMVEHDANPSATAKAYVPYSTAKPKIQSWTPGQK